MNNLKQRKNTSTPWTTPQITILSISRDTGQGPLNPPDPGQQS